MPQELSKLRSNGRGANAFDTNPGEYLPDLTSKALARPEPDDLLLDDVGKDKVLDQGAASNGQRQ